MLMSLFDDDFTFEDGFENVNGRRGKYKRRKPPRKASSALLKNSSKTPGMMFLVKHIVYLINAENLMRQDDKFADRVRQAILTHDYVRGEYWEENVLKDLEVNCRHVAGNLGVANITIDMQEVACMISVKKTSFNGYTRKSKRYNAVAYTFLLMTFDEVNEGFDRFRSETLVTDGETDMEFTIPYIREKGSLYILFVHQGAMLNGELLEFADGHGMKVLRSGRFE